MSQVTVTELGPSVGLGQWDDGAACEHSYGCSGSVSLPNDPPAFPFDPEAEPSLRRNVL